MRALVAAQDWLTVFKLPPYASELNPAESAWSPPSQLKIVSPGLYDCPPDRDGCDTALRSHGYLGGNVRPPVLQPFIQGCGKGNAEPAGADRDRKHLDDAGVELSVLGRPCHLANPAAEVATAVQVPGQRDVVVDRPAVDADLQIHWSLLPPRCPASPPAQVGGENSLWGGSFQEIALP
jgi:hypothetical protein